MLGHHFGRTIHVPGAAAADLAITINVPVDCRLVRVSAVASNDSDATLAIGVDGDPDDIMAATAIGDSGTPVVFDIDDWESTTPLGRLLQGELLQLAVDFDGAGGTAGEDITIDLDFVEG